MAAIDVSNISINNLEFMCRCHKKINEKKKILNFFFTKIKVGLKKNIFFSSSKNYVKVKATLVSCYCCAGEFNELQKLK